jgi:hypothetical protein
MIGAGDAVDREYEVSLSTLSSFETNH